MILGIDIGTRTTTVVSAISEQVIESRLVDKTEITTIGNNNELLNFKGKDVFANSGTYENNLYKYDKKNFDFLLNYSVCKLAKNNDKVNICFGIPVSQYNKKSIRDEMKKKIEDNKICSIGFYDEKGNLDYKTVTINDFIIRPEGYGIYCAIKSKVGILDINAKSILIDIGGKTIDITHYDTNGKILEGISLNYGLTRYFEMIKNEFDLSVEDAEKFARGLYKPKDLQILAYKPIEKEIFEMIYNDIVASFDNLNRYNIILCGGGANYFEEYFKEKKINCYVDKNVESNARTFYMLAKNKFDKQGE